MGDVSAEPSMEEILSSIKRIIAEEGEAAPRARRRVSPSPAPVGHDDVLELDQPVEEVAATVTDTPQPATPAEPIISSAAAEASRARLDSLSRLVVKPETAGADTLEGLVREMLKPMLRDWLDAHLPDIVERLVAQEISRISSQR